MARSRSAHGEFRGGFTGRRGAPLVILNACQSGKIETADEAAGPEASVATRLLLDGAASVVAMSHSVYVVAAAAFMAVFYGELLAGKSVSEAVNEGREALRRGRNCLRPSLKGDIPLQDWIGARPLCAILLAAAQWRDATGGGLTSGSDGG